MALYSGKNNRKKTIKNKLKTNVGISLIAIFSILLINLVFNILPIINQFLLGGFGILVYAIFISMIILGVMLILDKPVYLETKEIVLLCVWLFTFICIIHLATTTKIIESGYGNYLINCYNQKVSAGGVLFGVFVYPFTFLTHTVASFVIFSIVLIIVSAFLILRFYNFKQLEKSKLKTESILRVKEENKTYEEVKEKLITKEEKVGLPNRNSEDIFISDDEAKVLKKSKDVILETSSEDKTKAKQLLGLSHEENLEKKNDKKEIKQSLYPKAEIPNVTKPDFNNNTNMNLERPRKFIHTDMKYEEQYVEEKPVKKLSEADKKNLEFLRATGIGGKSLPEEPTIKPAVQEKRLESKDKDFDEFLNNYTNNIVEDKDFDLYDENISSKNYKQNFVAKQKLFQNNNNENEQFTPRVTPIFDDNHQLVLEKNSQKFENTISTEPVVEKINNPMFHTQSNSNQNYSKNMGVNETIYGNNNNELKTRNDSSTYGNSNNTPNTHNTTNNNNYSQMKLDGIDSQKPKKNIYKKPSKYIKPPIDLLKIIDNVGQESKEDYTQKAEVLEQALASFKIPAKVVSITKGPAFTRFELQMQQGVSVKRVNGYINDIAMILESHGDVRVEIPIAGKNAFGVEIPNESIATVGLRDILESYAFQGSKSLLTFGLGKDITGECKIAKLDKMPHLLVAGSTGSGKSVCLNSLLISLIYKAGPEDIKFILIDPKRVEFNLYNGLPHLLIPQVITSPDKAISSLSWAIDEMEKRFNLFADAKVRNMEEYNSTQEVINCEKDKMPYIVIVVDELADLLLQGKKEVEEKIMRIAQKSRAAGIHLVIATQRPSVDVITGTIKANLPSRIAFAVSSFPDSKTILDQGGAEKLLGKGDMLFSPLDMPDPTRIQGAFVSNAEVEAVVNFVKEHNEYEFDSEVADDMFNKKQNTFDSPSEEEYDPLLKDALRSIIRSGSASISKVQRMFGVGYPRAGKIIDQMEKAGFISPADNKNNRTIYINQQEFEEKFGEDL